MKDYIDKYHLKEGFLIAIIFPLIFVFSDSKSSNAFSHFISSFVIIFSLWIANFTLIDFRSVKKQFGKTKLLTIYGKLVASFILAILIYIAAGFLLDRSGSLLSEIRLSSGASFNSWLYLSIKIILFNALIILLKYLFDSNSDKRKIAFENEVLKRENLNALHETLKQQVNPHFLFNSLNTLKIFNQTKS